FRARRRPQAGTDAPVTVLCVLYSRVAAGHEGRVRGHGRQPGKIERSRYWCLPWRARQGWLARKWRPLDLSARSRAGLRPIDRKTRPSWSARRLDPCLAAATHGATAALLRDTIVNNAAAVARNESSTRWSARLKR